MASKHPNTESPIVPPCFSHTIQPLHLTSSVASHEHLSHLQQSSQIISNPASHPRQARPTPKISSSTSSIISLLLIPSQPAFAPTTSHQLLQTPRQPHAKLRQYLGQDPAGKQRHDDEDEHFHRVPAHVVVEVADEAAEAAHQTVGEVAPGLRARGGRVMSLGRGRVVRGSRCVGEAEEGGC